MKQQGIAPTRLLAAARRGHPGHAYLFYGPERYLLRLIIDRLAGCLPAEARPFNYRAVEGGPQNPAAQVLPWAYSPPLGAPWRLLVVWDEGLFAGKGKRREDEEAYLRYLAEPAPGCCLVLVGGAAVETEGRLYRALAKAGAVVYFGGLEANELRRWAQQEAARYGKALRPDALAYLLTASGGDLGFLTGAVAKACLYAAEEKEVGLAAVKEVVASTPQGGIFHLVDAVGERDMGQALVFLRRLLQGGEPPLRISHMLARQVRLILRAKLLASEGKEVGEIARDLQVPTFVAEKILHQARGFSVGSLEEALKKLLFVDGILKGAGRDPQAVLEDAVISLCRPAG